MFDNNSITFCKYYIFFREKELLIIDSRACTCIAYDDTNYVTALPETQSPTTHCHEINSIHHAIYV